MPLNRDDLKIISNTIKTLSIDAIQKAGSGHPGMPMGCADIAAVLWSKILIHNPDDPCWINRDRFVLSAGHGSMLLYSILHLCGYNISLDDIKNFRQIDSITPGHPESYCTDGVETTTGPLGQGFANGVGMSLASKLLMKEFNTKNENIIDHNIYGIVSDGDMMEGISSEAASLAGHMGLGNLIYIYDSNDISIEGNTNLTFSEDVAKRFESYNWHVQKIDGHNYEEIEEALINAGSEKEKPSLIVAKTIIAKGSVNKEGSEESHGAPLGEDDVKATKIEMGCNGDDLFCVPAEAYEILNERKKSLAEEYIKWKKKFDKIISGDLKSKWDSFFTSPDISSLREKFPEFDPEKDIATRSASGKILEVLFKELPNLVGGSADLGPSNKSFVKGYDATGKNKIGRNIHFGIREHAMGSIQNGIAYYGGFIPYSATFFVFMDYMRPSVRLASLCGLQTIYVYTHDSIFVGEDGPTHQPVEHLAVARAIPDLNVLRPADAEETKEAWLSALSRTDGPTLLSLTRQNIPQLARKKGSEAENFTKGAYIVKDCDSNPHIIILSSGSEVHLSIDAAEDLGKDGINVRVVSFPSWELFDAQDESYKKKILPGNIPVAVVEAGIQMGWEKYAGKDALFITMKSFGVSAPFKDLAERFGFTKSNLVKEIKKYLEACK